MSQTTIIAGFIGAGGIARSHAFCLNSLRYYYDGVPDVELRAVCSAREESRMSFMNKYGFSRATGLDEFANDETINTVFILGPNKVHYHHLRTVLGMNNVKRVYLEKPVCSGKDEEDAIRELVRKHPDTKIQVGFQYLFSPAIREAIVFWRSGRLGKPLHFDLKYYHSDYLRKDYRDHRQNRLTPAPDGGAMADLGSHGLSILTAFLGEGLIIRSALQGGHFEDVDERSDLFSLISLFHPGTGAVGTLSASRISSGTGDMLTFEFFCEKGSLRYSSLTPDFFEYYIEDTGIWSKQFTGSNYRPVTSFPSGHVPPGWLRSMIHAHYVFLTGNDKEGFFPGIEHGLAVQRLVTHTADHLQQFRESPV